MYSKRASDVTVNGHSLFVFSHIYNVQASGKMWTAQVPKCPIHFGTTIKIRDIPAPVPKCHRYFGTSNTLYMEVSHSTKPTLRNKYFVMYYTRNKRR